VQIAWGIAALAAGYVWWTRRKSAPTMAAQIAAGLPAGVSYRDLETPVFEPVKPGPVTVTITSENAPRVQQQAPTLVVPTTGGSIAAEDLRRALADNLVKRLESGRGLNTITAIQAEAVVQGRELVGKQPPAGSPCKPCPLGYDYQASGRESAGVCGGCVPIGFIAPLIRNPNTANGLPPIANPEWVEAFQRGKVDKQGNPVKA
jgi:hypothetical protein